jgi:hypothetical protein
MFRDVNNRWRRINVCKFPSHKNGQNIWTESIGELCLAMFCERDRNIVRYSTQSVRIHYYLDGKQRYYTPDFLIYRKVGRPLIVEFKYERQITAWFDQLFRIVTPICDCAGFDFEVKTERHILVEPLLTTVKRLRYYSRTPIHPHHQLWAHGFLSKRKAATLGEMFDFFELEDPNAPSFWRCSTTTLCLPIIRYRLR